MSEFKHRFVLGFMFSEAMGEVVLVLKNRPAWQDGKWNGIGGKIESGETPLEAMQREFVEETYLVGHHDSSGALVRPDWKLVGHRSRDSKESYEMYIFACTWSNVDEALYDYRDPESSAQHLVPEVPDPRREPILVVSLGFLNELEYQGVRGLESTVLMARSALIEGYTYTVKDH